MRTSGAVNTAKTAGYHGICWIPMAMPGAGSCREWDHAGSGIMPGVGSCREWDHAGGGIMPEAGSLLIWLNSRT